MTGDRTSNVERAIIAFTNALGPNDQSAADMATSRTHLALAYIDRVENDRAHNLGDAISICRQVLETSSAEDSQATVALANHALGTALLLRGRGAGTEDTRLAVEHLRVAEGIFADVGLASELARTLLNLGHAYWDQLDDNPDEAVERALMTWIRAREVHGTAMAHEHAPFYVLGHIEYQLGLAYSFRRRGDRGDNRERAIVAFRVAHKIYTNAGMDTDAAAALHSLGAAYLNRTYGDQSDNLRLAREALEAVRQTRSRQVSPVEWALTESTLGVVYARQAESDPHVMADLTEMAIAAYEGALSVLDPSLHAEEWEKAQSSLGVAYLQRSSGNEAQNRALAISAFERAIDCVSSRGDSSPESLMTFHNLAEAYRARDRGRRGADLERAVDAWRTCVDRLAMLSRQDLYQGPARSLGDALSDLQRWDEAASAYLIALKATESLYRSSFLTASKNHELASGSDISSRAAYAMLRSDLGRAGEAILVLERGRARNLAEQLRRRSLELSASRIGDPELRDAYRATVAELQELNEVLRRGSPLSWLIEHMEGGPTDLVDSDEARQAAAQIVTGRLSLLNEQLHRLADEIRLAGSEPYDEERDVTVAGIAGTLLPDVPLAYLACTPFGTVLLILVHDPPDHRVVTVMASDFTESDLDRVLGLSRGGTEQGHGYLSGQLGFGEPMPDHVQRLLAALGERMLRPLVRFLLGAGSSGVVLVPCGRLGVLPLHAASVYDDRCLLDYVDVSFAPSGGALRAAREAVTARESTPERLAGVADASVDHPLAWARAELAEVASAFRDHAVYFGSAATKSALLDASVDASYVHLACHGRYDVRDPLSSELVLADTSLTVSEVLRERPFARARLVVASACQTAVTEFLHLPDEVLGLPTAFLSAGTPAVIGTLWPVNDLSTALLMAQFYRLHLRGSGSGPLEPAAALRAAQLWLRDLTGQLLLEEAKTWPHLAGAAELLNVARDNPTVLLFRHPSYWSPYVIVGA